MSRTSPVTWYGSVVVTYRHSHYLHWDSGCILLQQNGKLGLYDSIIRDIEVEGAVFIHTSFSFPWFFVSFLMPLFHSVWGLITGGTWTSRTFAWLPPSRHGSGFNFPVKPCMTISIKVPYPYTLMTPEGSVGLHTCSTQGCWLAKIT